MSTSDPNEPVLFLVYAPSDGRIVANGAAARGVAEKQALYLEDRAVLIVDDQADPETMCIVEGAVEARPSLPEFDQTEIAADDTDVATISGLPDPCTVIVDGVAHAIEGGSLALSSPMPATYVVEIKHWPYKEARYEIVAR
ncbi:hypothetical protein [Inquilinus sp. OTU3971]|uniref:hypothetical protein n=1 Tax=Inquilinus sp. OTU3971 TaxID=3043855 RepID=UPI00313AEA44